MALNSCYIAACPLRRAAMRAYTVRCRWSGILNRFVRFWTKMALSPSLPLSSMTLPEAQRIKRKSYISSANRGSNRLNIAVPIPRITTAARIVYPSMGREGKAA